MTDMTIKTQGVHHIGLTVSDLAATTQFFIEAVGFKQVAEKPDYPAIFVSDGTTMITLWQAENPALATPFDRKKNIGLHHMALKLQSSDDLSAMHEKIKNWPGVTVEFAPEQVGSGAAKHMMIYEPSGIRIEFFYAPAPNPQ